MLLNPAFEASRYDGVFEASRHYTPRDGAPPLLVTLTSTADWATKKAFPVARFVNSIFQYPSSSEEQSFAMKRTHGHIDRYLTHTLCLDGHDCPAPDEAKKAGKSRRYCGGLQLWPHDAGAGSSSIATDACNDDFPASLVTKAEAQAQQPAPAAEPAPVDVPKP